MTQKVHHVVNKKRLIILSDLWGLDGKTWIQAYVNRLSRDFDVYCYDCCQLAQIPTGKDQQTRHDQFINGGIQKAVEQLLSFETQPIHILGFSIGGTIAWKFAIKSKVVESLFCLSSTRLRKETIRPEAQVRLYYGADDMHKPSTQWLNAMAVKHQIFNGKNHNFYSVNAECISMLICDDLNK